MEINKEVYIEQDTVGTFKEITSSIRAEDLGMALDAVSKNLYSNPIGSFVRELVSNGVDANRANNSAELVKVNIYKEGNTWLKKHGEKGVTKIDETLPQYKAALESVLGSWLKKSTPGSQYLDAYYRQQGHPFDEETAKKIINDRLKTFTFSQENRNAIRLYEKNGFQKNELLKDEYGSGEDRYLMIKVFNL